jgi:ribonuclease PH
MLRSDGRKNLEIRPCKITRKYLKSPEGSVLIELGDTKVICTATIEDKVPGWMKDSGKGWITAEYGLLPRSTTIRSPREALRGKVNGRTSEIMRLIGRSLRSVVDLHLLGERQIVIDCDVIQADGGTRTASVTGSFVALVDAIGYLKEKGALDSRPVRSYLAAISCGIVEGEELLDLNYEEDSQAQADVNVVMTSTGDLVEIQGTGEKEPFQVKQLYRLVEVAKIGIDELVACQKEVLSDVKGIIWPDAVHSK